MKNRFHLTRNIPSNIRREIRQRSGFGCVICRHAIVQYEHIDPTFSDARIHDPDRICLLCGHCHDKVTRGLLGKDVVLEQYKEVQQNKKKRPFDQFHFRNSLNVSIGSLSAYGTPILMNVDRRPLLTISPPESGSNVPRLSGQFTDHMGREIFQINDNIWSGSLDCWDIKITGSKIIIRTAPREIALELEFISSSSLAINRINMRWGNAHFVTSKNEMTVGHINGHNSQYLAMGGFHVDAAESLIDVDSSKLSAYPSGFSMDSNGLIIKGSGITLGKNPKGIMEASSLKVFSIGKPGADLSFHQD